MIILVTGGNGFIGGQLFKKLSEINLSPLKIDLEDFFTNSNQINHSWRDKLVSLIEDISPDVIFHVGACSNTLEKRVNYMMELNYESTKLICDWCVANNKKIIFSSSAANYGIDNYPSNLYGWSKYVSEGYVTSNNGIALRYFNVYGEGESHKGSMASFVYQCYRKKCNEEGIRIFPGYPKRDFVYIDDVLSANIFALENYESLKGEWYDVGSGDSRKFEDILECLRIESFEYTDRSEIPNGYQFITSSSKFMHGWSPKYNLESGIKEYINRIENG